MDGGGRRRETKSSEAGSSANSSNMAHINIFYMQPLLFVEVDSLVFRTD